LEGDESSFEVGISRVEVKIWSSNSEVPSFEVGILSLENEVPSSEVGWSGFKEDRWRSQPNFPGSTAGGWRIASNAPRSQVERRGVEGDRFTLLRDCRDATGLVATTAGYGGYIGEYDAVILRCG